METTNCSQSLEERENELRITAAVLSSCLKSLSEIAHDLSVKADKLAAERRALAQREQHVSVQTPPSRPEGNEYTNEEIG